MRNPNALVEYYRQTASNYDNTRFPWLHGVLGEIEKEEISKLLQGSLFLECGVGTGKKSASFGGIHSFVGCDISREMITICKARLKYSKTDADLVLADVHNLPFVNNAFDSALCSRTFKFLSKPHQFLNDVKRCLKKGGRCIVSSALYESSWFELAVRIGLIRLYDKKARTEGQYYSADEALRIFQEAGFTAVHIRPVGNLLFGFYSFLWFNLYDTPLAFMLKYLPVRLSKLKVLP